MTGGKACLATAAGTLDQHLKCGWADSSLALGRGRPGVWGVPVTSTDDFDRDLNGNRIFTTSDAQHYKRREPSVIMAVQAFGIFLTDPPATAMFVFFPSGEFGTCVA